MHRTDIRSRLPICADPPDRSMAALNSVPAEPKPTSRFADELIRLEINKWRDAAVNTLTSVHVFGVADVDPFRLTEE